VVLTAAPWRVFNKPALHNTRAVVRYLARYTSRIAISNQRLTGIDEERRRVSFRWKDYRDGGTLKQMTLEAAEFVRRFARHLVPKGLRRIRSYGLLCGRRGRAAQLRGAPAAAIAEKPLATRRPSCPKCRCTAWLYLGFYQAPRELDATHCASNPQRYSLSSPKLGP